MSEKTIGTLDSELLEILVCPDSRAPLVLVGERLISTDPETRRAYPVEDGIPRMLVEESEQLTRDAWEALMNEADRGDLVK